jgi:hypothetical protein
MQTKQQIIKRIPKTDFWNTEKSDKLSRIFQICRTEIKRLRLDPEITKNCN